MPLKAKKIIGRSAAIVLVAAWFASGILENSYVDLLRSANPLEDRTVPHAVKGIVVYTTNSHFYLGHDRSVRDPDTSR
jgi:hypothetical protein